MNNKIRIMCFFPLILSVIVTIIYHEVNKDPPIDYEEYQKMPPLYLMDDYDDCMKGQKGAKYCVVNILIEKDEKSDVWRQIEEFSADYKHHFRHDILKYGFCLDRIRQNLTNFDVTEANGSSKMNFKIDEIQFRQLGKILKEFSFDAQDEKDLELYVKHKFRTEYALNAYANVSFCISNDAEKQENDSSYFGTNFLIKSLIVTIIYVIIIATVFDLCRNQNNLVYPTDFCSCISLRTTLTRLFNDPSNSNQLGALNGIKVVGEAGVVVVHTAYILFVLPSGIPFSIESQTYGAIVPIIRSGVFQLQNFFAITGFLSFYPNLKKILKGENVTLKDIQWMILKRIFRLWPAMIFVMLVTATFLFRIQNGPLWIDLASGEMLSCRRNWWTNLLFVNNFVAAATEPCLQHTWHLAAEMQLFVVEILIILILTRFPKKVGTILASVTLLGNFFTTTAFYKSGINGLVLGTVETTRNRNRFDAEFQLGHIPFYTNFPGYCLGLLAAYVHHQIKHKKLDLSSISKTKLRIWYVLFFFNALILLHHSYYVGIVDKPSLIMAIYSTFCKNVGAIVTFTLLILMGNPEISSQNLPQKLMGVTNVPLIDSLLLKLYEFYNHRMFKVLVKLNLGVFLVHPYVAGWIVTDGRHLVMYGNAFDVAWIGFSTLIVSYFIATWLFLFVEMPAINLFRFFAYKKPAEIPKKLK
ncbi:regulator of hypoxia-inducible factor 1-like [Culicoides brevitarsis]|uniref:regulator of hypoxia-inducible factor 1-like n=1 Tax=Culicoides brevitarsis TaxID=469753 RepID=UPI00307C0398